MSYFYVLLNVEDDMEEFYIGSTSDLKKRYRDHCAGRNKSTAGRKWRLVYYEAYLTLKAARERERKLKNHGRTKQLLLERIRNSLE